MNESVSASALRRNNGHRLSMTVGGASRASFRSSRLFETNIISELPVSSASGSASASSKRKSLLLLTPASTTKRRKSSFGLQQPTSSLLSGVGGAGNGFDTPAQNHNFGGHVHSLNSNQTPINSIYPQALGPQQQNNGLHGLPVDPRPIRDKNYISLIQQEIYDFLSANKFEVETNHPLTQKTLKQPTQKDFVVIFHFLYHKIDPMYKFIKSIDTEVFSILRILEYPYLETLNRSQVSSVNAQNWPNILGMLYWIVKLNLLLLNININQIKFTNYDDKLDQIFIKYMRNSYKSFINMETEYKPRSYQELTQDYEEFIQQILGKTDEIERENEVLVKEYKESETQWNLLVDTEQRLKALETDLVTLKAYVETLQQVRAGGEEKLKLLEEELSKQENQLLELTSDISKTESELLKSGITTYEIDTILRQRDELSKEINGQQELVDLQRNKYQVNEIDLHRKYESLNNFINQYNNLIHKIETTTSTKPNTMHDLKFKIGSDLLNNGISAHLPLSIIQGNRKLSDEKVQLERLRGQIRTNVIDLEKKCLMLQGEIDVIEEFISQQRENLDSLSTTIDQGKINAENDLASLTMILYQYAIEQKNIQEDIKKLRYENKPALLLQSENLVRKTESDYEVFEREISKDKEELRQKVHGMMDEVVRFKMEIQDLLAPLDSLAMDVLGEHPDKDIEKESEND